ncbi:hypothetical protein H634G_04051 [Metarhizium anisopliae BRIP 53293]|uniref:Glucose-methanol-choline oxidoreductase N-terminal domain-containing protein n=1 Tax=Metarhizium anisopliae BRIP 53293 TaxID=1291518 RepID=A0A0D9P0I8_METAN|nr:hypothetical protein H634G_04051 [Metarhizium anisopliae BRIP 53293]KJK95816.1 hypothetical protein H633G_00165 [Metarhizium anisopliae BRIP 53284]
MGHFPWLRAVLGAAVASLAVASNDGIDGTSVDYLIIGGGPAGLVLAEKLSRNPRKHIVLLEAGPDSINDSLVNTPAHYPLIKEQHWNFTTEPDSNLGGHAPGIAQGRTLGGGSAVNGMAYCRGASSLFDEWAHLSGNPGLAWKSMLQEFREVSHYQDPPHAEYEQYVNISGYGNGPLEVSRSSGLTGFEFPFKKAIQGQLGLDEADLTDGTGIGIDMGVATIFAKNRTRSYPRNTFGLIAERRPNVRIIHDAWVSKVDFKGQTAVGATYRFNGKDVKINAREVIVSGGAINTPKLLMLSGVGPKDVLSKWGIPVVAESPEVGANLRDHPVSIVELRVTPEVLTLWQWAFNETEADIAKIQYAANASGPLGWNNGLVFATFRVPDSVWGGIDGSHFRSLPQDRPHVMIEFSTVPFIPSPNASTITAWASLVQPEASGRVSLRSANYQDDPLIYTNYYGSVADKAAILWTYKKLREILQRPEVSPLIESEHYPGPGVTTDEAIWAAMGNQTYSFRHPVGTVAIGKVLDRNWRVKGLKGIRVVDSSTFPYPTTCHPQAVVYALASRAAKDILEADCKR